MATNISILTRRELESDRKFGWLPAVLVPGIALLLQWYVPKSLHAFTYLDLPLLVTIFFAVARRSPVAGMFTGFSVGILQDAVSGNYIGVNGIADTVVGYIGSSISMKLEVEHTASRLLTIFGFKFLHDLIGFMVQSRIVGSEWMYRSRWELYSAIANAVVGVALFHFLDKLKKRN